MSTTRGGDAPETFPGQEDDRVRYRVLGPLSVRGDAGPVRLGGAKQRTTLALLLLNANRVVSEERFIDALWGDDPPSSARSQLQVRIWELRKLLGRSAIVRRPPGYLIQTEPGEVDLDVFDATAAEAEREAAAGRPRRAADLLRTALELWQGPPLGGVAEPFAAREAPMFEERRVAALEQLFDAELTLGRHVQVTGELRRASKEYPFRERLQYLLILAQHRSGRSSEALETYADVRRTLSTELGIEPGKALQELHLQVLNGQGGQGAEKGGAEPPPAKPAAVVRPAELPHDVRGFVGRSDCLSRLDDQLGGGSGSGEGLVDVWVLSGTAGVGKTALAVHWARRVRERFPDGQLYLDLRGFDVEREPLDPSAALAQLLRALGTDPQRIPDDPDELVGLYRSLLEGKRLLLVLDNVRESRQVRPLLPPTGTVLVTSRHRLGELIVTDGARPLPLSTLHPDSSRALLGEILGEEQLRAEPEAAGELARLCGHLPLALRIAAAKISAGPEPRISDAVTELTRGRPLDVLTVDGSEESAITRAFTVSYRALAPGPQRLFRLLGLVPGADFTPEAAAALADVPVAEASRRLSRLAAAHLVEQHVTGRYRFHDLVRDYARDRVQEDEEAGPREEAWARLIEYHVSAVDAAYERFRTRDLRIPRDPSVKERFPVAFTDSLQALAWFDAEHENLVALLLQAAVRGPHPLGWCLAEGLRIIFNHRGLRTQWVEVAPAIRAAAREHGARRAEALMLESEGVACIQIGEHERAIRCLTEARRIYIGDDCPQGEASTTNSLGVTLQSVGRLDEAATELKRALELQQALGNRSGEIMVYNNLGLVYRMLARLDEAAEHLGLGRTLAIAEGTPWDEAVNLVSEGFVLRLRGEHDAAEKALTRGREIHRELGHRYGESYALSGLSALEADAGRCERARESALQALELAQDEHNVETEVLALIALGRAEATLDEADSAEQSMRRAVELAREWGSLVHIAEALSELCTVQTLKGDHLGALDTGREAVGLMHGCGLWLIEAQCLLAMAGAHRGLGDPVRARDLGRRSMELAEENGLAIMRDQARRWLEEFCDEPVAAVQRC
ncbi:tetratricopeptide repeat protein [Nocardiopsis sp. CNT-189]|uniref:AfsR/SARP family transcriptional regulator n=1 Tax=Nocardiopsis oceanisediminis TaxID=2816862 RepID=UPI003B31EB34